MTIQINVPDVMVHVLAHILKSASEQAIRDFCLGAIAAAFDNLPRPTDTTSAFLLAEANRSDAKT